VSARAAAERFSVGLGYLMASRAFLAGVSRVGLHHHYAVQSGFIQDESEKLVERPLRLLQVVAHSTATSLFQFLQYNGPTMFHSVFRTSCVWTACCESCEADAVHNRPRRGSTTAISPASQSSFSGGTTRNALDAAMATTSPEPCHGSAETSGSPRTVATRAGRK